MECVWLKTLKRHFTFIEWCLLLKHTKKGLQPKSLILEIVNRVPLIPLAFFLLKNTILISSGICERFLWIIQNYNYHDDSYDSYGVCYIKLKINKYK